jgi:hypothetical protein
LHLDILYKVMSEYINEDRDDIEDEAHVPTWWPTWGPVPTKKVDLVLA